MGTSLFLQQSFLLDRHRNLPTLGEVDSAVVLETAEGFECEGVSAGFVGTIKNLRTLTLEAAAGGFQPDEFRHLERLNAE